MAKAAERHADQVVVSSDNPRSEAQQKIISEICSGFEKNSFEVEADRKLAIAPSSIRRCCISGW